MSLTTNNVGQNITNSVHVLKETYRNLNSLFIELDRNAEELGYIPITSKFLRWKSDSHYQGWMTSNFIKLYQLKTDPPSPAFSDLRDGYLFGVEVELEGEEHPLVSIIRYSFDYNDWPRMPTPADHWIFYGPFREERCFDITEHPTYWHSTPLKDVKNRYWGLKEAIAIEIPLVSIQSQEDIKGKVFNKFEVLTNL